MRKIFASHTAKRSVYTPLRLDKTQFIRYNSIRNQIHLKREVPILEHQSNTGFLLKNILLMLLVLGLIAGFVISLVTHTYWVTLLTAGGFLLLLDAVLWSTELEKTRKRSLLFPLLLLAAAVLLIVCGILMKTVPDQLASFFETYAPDCVMLLCAAVGAGIITAALTEPKRKLLVCTEPVTAVCSELLPHQNKSGRTYAPVYEFQLNGKTCRVADTLFTASGNPEPGETRQIYADPVSADEIYDPARSANARKWLYVFGICLIALPLFCFAKWHNFI